MTGFLSRRIVRRLRDCSGNSMLEAAFIAPLLFLITFAIVDFASILYVHLALQNGVGQASRYGVTGQVIAGQSREGSIRTAMRQATPTLTLADAAFTFSNLPAGSSTWAGGSGGAGAVDKVTVRYTWTLLTPVLRPFFPTGRINFTVESVMKNEGVFP
jgi:Flp pilus assembly protein TadG